MKIDLANPAWQQTLPPARSLATDAPVAACAFNKDGSIAAFALGDGQVRLLPADIKAAAPDAAAPLHKGVINDAGVPFSGHTEYLADSTGTPRVVMMLAGRTGANADGPWLRVALATTHLPLSAVPAAITRESLTQTLRILDADLRARFDIARPHIVVAGLNPHAGEGGHMGREEIDVITPVLDALRAEGMDLEGPLPADTLFVPRHLDGADAVLAMFHDQGLPVLKYATFGHGINITLGLPIIRTSVDHGTALDLAGSGRADAGSLIEAVEAAIAMSRH